MYKLKLIEHETNIKEIRYSTFGHMPLPLVRFQSIWDYILQNESIVVTSPNGTTVDTTKVFQYVRNQMNSAISACSVYALDDDEKHDFLVRTLEWDRPQSKLTVLQNPRSAELEVFSRIYYIDRAASAHIHKLLEQAKDLFQQGVAFCEKDTRLIDNSVFLECGGYSYSFQWGSPFSAPQVEDKLEKMIADIHTIISDSECTTIPKVEVLYDILPWDYEKML